MLAYTFGCTSDAPEIDPMLKFLGDWRGTGELRIFYIRNICSQITDVTGNVTVNAKISLSPSDIDRFVISVNTTPSSGVFPITLDYPPTAGYYSGGKIDPSDHNQALFDSTTTGGSMSLVRLDGETLTIRFVNYGNAAGYKCDNGTYFAQITQVELTLNNSTLYKL